MELKQISAADMKFRVIKGLGLDPAKVIVTSPEVIAGLLRRAGSFLCPCPNRKLVNEVINALLGLVEELENLRQATEDMLERLIALGDFFEYDTSLENQGRGGTLVYSVPPSFVRRRSGSVLLLGSAPDNALPVPNELKSQVEYKVHARRISSDRLDDLASYLLHLDFIELSQKTWLRSPPLESPKQFLGNINDLLESAPPSGDIPGLSLLNSSAPVHYYRGRWVGPNSKTEGRFVARRKQLYGADLWCYVEVQKGVPRKLLDLPFSQSRWRGCDDAWRLQAAIDVTRGTPQIFRVRSDSKELRILDFFSPVPNWAIRRWDAFGEAVDSKSLFSYRFSERDIEEEIAYAENMLWLEHI